jgi:hypothetical protein
VKVQRIGTMKIASLLRARAVWLCVLAALAVLSSAAGGGLLRDKAQSPPAPAAASSASAQAPMPAQQAVKPSADTALDGRKKQIGGDCASLLKLANGLKAEVDKTTKDTLSVTVIRKAGEIEQLARKMKDEMKPVVGKS